MFLLAHESGDLKEITNQRSFYQNTVLYFRVHTQIRTLQLHCFLNCVQSEVSIRECQMCTYLTVLIQKDKTAVCSVRTHLNTADTWWKSVQNQHQAFTPNYLIPSLLKHYTETCITPGLKLITVSSNLAQCTKFESRHQLNGHKSLE